MNENYTLNGEITYNTETKEYTVWDETYSNTICITCYVKVAENALIVYFDNYLNEHIEFNSSKSETCNSVLAYDFVEINNVNKFKVLSYG